MTTSTTTELRETAPPLHSPPIPRRSADPTRVFIDKDRLARFWFLVAAAVLIGTAAERIHLARTLKERERVVIVDPAGTFFVTPLLQFQEARELHAQQSTLAAVANPSAASARTPPSSLLPPIAPDGRVYSCVGR